MVKRRKTRRKRSKMKYFLIYSGFRTRKRAEDFAKSLRKDRKREDVLFKGVKVVKRRGKYGIALKLPIEAWMKYKR
jgi:hypothetical protein